MGGCRKSARGASHAQSYFDPWRRGWALPERMHTPRNSSLCGTVAGIAELQKEEERVPLGRVSLSCRAGRAAPLRGGSARQPPVALQSSGAVNSGVNLINGRK